MTGNSRGEELFQRWLDEREIGGEPDVTDWLQDEHDTVAQELRAKIADFEALYQHLKGPPGGIAAGSRLGPYLLLKKLGTGGMGEVWQATEEPLARDVAVKLLPPLFGLSPQARLRFARETRAASRVEHPQVLRVYAAGEVAGVPFLATELVPGGRTLEHWIADLHATAPGRAEYRRVAEMFSRIAEGLAAVHARGILHRDLKPSNVLVTPEGVPKLADFGMARFEGAETVTVTGGQIGTPRYMAPEIIRNARAASPLSDLFSLGATLYEALTGLPAFEGDAREQVAHAILTRDPLSPRLRRSQVPQELEVLCLRCLEKDPARRPASAFFLVEEFQRFLRGEPLQSRSPGGFERLQKAVRRNPWRSAAFTVLAAGLFASATALHFLAVRNQILEDALAETGTVSNLLQPAGFGPSRKGARESLVRQKERLDSLSLSQERRARVLADLGRGMVFLEEYLDGLAWLEEAFSLSQQELMPRAFKAEVELFTGWAIGRSTRDQSAFHRAEMLLRGVVADPGDDEGASIRRDWARNRLGMVVLETGMHLAIQSQDPDDLAMAKILHHAAGQIWLELERDLLQTQDSRQLEILALTLLDLSVQTLGFNKTEESCLRSIGYCTRARQIYLASFGPEHPELAYVDLSEAISLRILGRTEEAIELLNRSRERIGRLYGPGAPMEFEIGLTLLECVRLGRGLEAARQVYDELVASLETGTRPFRAEGENWREEERKRLGDTWASLSEN